MASDVSREYDRVLDYCQKHDVPEYMLEQSVAWQRGLWKIYQPLLEISSLRFEGKVAVDFGCKYGHLLPLLVVMGVSQAIGIEVEDSYLDPGRAVFEKLYSNVRFLKSEMGYIPLQPDTTDFVLVNEVISHINPGYLDIFYGEIARILKTNGVALVSDGNNIDNPGRREKLISLYMAWENGPDGTQTDRDTVTECYLHRRKKIIHARHPDLSETNVDYLARNTSGLFGDFLNRTVDRYVETGDLIRRPYRQGVYPTNPGPSGVVMERGFHPSQVVMGLASYGLECRQVSQKPTFNRRGLIGPLKDMILWGRYQVKRILKPKGQGTGSEGFQIVGIKKSCAA